MREEYKGPLAALIFKPIPDLGPSFRKFARKVAAFKCPRCHSRSTSTERRPCHLHVVDELTHDPAMGQPSGFERRRYLVRRVCCAEPFWADRRDRETCSPSCRVRAHRAAGEASG